MRNEARVVVIGGGVAGCSLLYHLTRLGWSDVVLVEKDELTSGSTWHAAGLCTQFNPSYNMMNLLRYSVELYESLEAETGQAVDYHRCGSLRLAASKDRLDEFRHRKGIADALGIPFEILSPDRAQELFPLANFDDVLAAAHLPTDGFIDPTGLTHALAKGAQAKGAEVVRHAEVTAIEREADGWLVRTSKGDVRAEIVVNAAGQWARELGRMVGIELPIVPIEHHYLITEPLQEVGALATELPVLRDADASFYVRGEGGALLVGPFERDTKPWATDGIPKDFHSSLLPPDLDRLESVLEAVAKRIPAFANAGIKTVVNGPDGYTPDGHCLMGPVPGLRDFHVLAGFSIFGIIFGGGAGRYAAEWIVEGQTSDNMWELDVRRFDDYAASTEYVTARACEVYGREYAIHYPEEELPAGRPLKTGPLYDRLLSQRAPSTAPASPGSARSGSRRAGPPATSTRFGAPPGTLPLERSASPSNRGSAYSTRRASPSTRSRGPVPSTSSTGSARTGCPQAVGRIALTQMCTPRGGVECDVTVTRLAEDRFYVVSAAATERHDFAWIARHLPDDGSVALENVTEPRCRSHAGRAEVTRPSPGADRQRRLEARAFRFFRSRELHVGMVPVRALRVSFVGELGYELHHPVAYQRHLYDLLMREGEQYGIVDWGYRTLDCDAAREGLPPVGRRHVGRLDAARVRHGALRRLREGRLHRPRGAPATARPRSRALPGLPRRRRRGRGRARLRAGALDGLGRRGDRVRGLGRLRTPRGEVDLVRLPANGVSRDRDAARDRHPRRSPPGARRGAAPLRPGEPAPALLTDCATQTVEQRARRRGVLDGHVLLTREVSHYDLSVALGEVAVDGVWRCGEPSSLFEGRYIRVIGRFLSVRRSDMIRFSKMLGLTSLAVALVAVAVFVVAGDRTLRLHYDIQALLMRYGAVSALVFEPVGKIPIFLNPSDRMITPRIMAGLFELRETQVVLGSVGRGDTFVDVGANVGYYTLLAAKLVGEEGRVIAFEPDPESFALLERNVRLNGFENVILEQKAVSNEPGTVRLYLAPENKGDHRIYETRRQPREFVEVEAVTLDHYFSDDLERIDFVKIDVQGADLAVLEGMTEIFDANQHLLLSVEFWPYGLREFGDEARDLLDFAVARDFRLYDFRAGEVEPEWLLRTYRLEEPLFTNLLFVKGRAAIEQLRSEIEHWKSEVERDDSKATRNELRRRQRKLRALQLGPSASRNQSARRAA